MDALLLAADRLDGEDEQSNRYAAPGDLAQALDARTVQTPALQLLDEHLLRIDAGTLPRLVWTMPPQEGKSQRISRWFPVWTLMRHPETRIAIVSYELGVARRWGRAIRNAIAEHPELGLAVKPDTSAAHEWELVGHEGGVVSVGIGGPLVGRPVDLMIIDDPVKGRNEAESETYREDAWDWWTGTASNRFGPEAVCVLLMTRWHHDDLAGRILAKDKASGLPPEWVHVNIPARANHDPNKGEADPLGREPGQWMASARRRSTANWEQRERDAGPRDFQALFQGAPTPGEGRIFKKSEFAWYDLPRAVQLPNGTWKALGVEVVVASWDMAFKDTRGSDYVCGQIWGRRGADAFLLDQVWERIEFTETCRAVEMLHFKWPQATRILVEDKANGPAVISQLRRTVPGLIPVTPEDSKVARARAVSPFVAAGNIHLPAPALAPWIADTVVEFCAFPAAPNDDRVDAMTQALHCLYISGASDAGDYMAELLATH